LNQTYDVVVVGGGVSGLSAGLSASAKGAKTLVIDRKKQIGTPVRCGEFFPTPNEASSLLPDSESFKRFYALIRNDAISNKTKTIRVFSPHGRKYEFSFEGWVLRREIFEKTIAEEAVNEGARIQTSTSIDAIQKLENGMKIRVRGVKGEAFLNAKVVIGADGFPSRIVDRKEIEPYIKDDNLALCAQTKASDARVDEEVVEMHMGLKYSPGGYAWVIPKGAGEVNVGVGMRLSYLKRGRSVANYLTDFTQNHPIVSRYLQGARFAPLIAKLLPVGGMAPFLYGDGRLLVGDAAGLVIATNGSGIPTALASGHIGGEVAARHVSDRTDLSVYADALKKEVGKPLRRTCIYRRMGDVFMRSDWAFERLLQIIGTGNLAKVVKGVPIRPFFR
jgi:digeranylgeranylglycerophospholipid reductase